MTGEDMNVMEDGLTAPENTEAGLVSTEEYGEAVPTETQDDPSASAAINGEESEGPDYALIVEEDLKELRSKFPELAGIRNITELDNPLRYATLRDLGLTPREAYLATSERRGIPDNRRHLSSAVPRGAGGPVGAMSRTELERARELFPGLGDAELHSLYKKVSV